VFALIQGSPDIHFVIKRQNDNREYTLDTDELLEQLGGEVPLNEPEVLAWISDFVNEQELRVVSYEL